MKILHMADLHLGAKVAGKDRLEKQKKVMSEIAEICDQENIDIVIIAGDVYNSSTPSALAEELFYQTVEQLSNGGNRFVFVLSGNHDHPKRLCAGLPLAFKHNIVLAGDLEALSPDKFARDKEIKVIGSGEGFIKLEKNNEKVVIAYLPYDSTFENLDGDKSYGESVNALANKCAVGFEENSFNVFVSHLFMVGACLNGDKKVQVGDVFAVGINQIPKADYIALGHLHRNQEIAPNIWYSGSTSRLSVGSYPLCVNIVKTNGKSCEVYQKILQSAERFETLKVSNFDEAKEKLKEFDSQDMVELIFSTKEPLKASETKILRKEFPCINSIAIEFEKDQEQVEEQNNVKLRKNLPDCELFKEFYKSKRFVYPRESLLELFMECKGGQDETNKTDF